MHGEGQCRSNETTATEKAIGSAPERWRPKANAMKQKTQCPKCENREIFHAETVMDRGYMDSPSPMALGTQKTRVGWFWKAVPWGQLEAFTCRQCGYTEFYVKDVQELPTQ